MLPLLYFPSRFKDISDETSMSRLEEEHAQQEEALIAEQTRRCRRKTAPPEPIETWERYH